MVTTTELNLELINQKIIKEIHENNKEDEDDDSETEIDKLEGNQIEITINEVKKSIEVINQYALNHQNVDDYLVLIDKLESKLIEDNLSKSKQALITNCFNKTN